MSLPIQHLSDEAIAAFADSVLGPGARERAARHVAQCPDCAGEVRAQREARLALQTAVAPSVPSALLDRLRALPMTAPLPGPPGPPNLRTVVIGEGGRPMFAAFGTRLDDAPPAPPEPAPPEPAPLSAPPTPSVLPTQSVLPTAIPGVPPALPQEFVAPARERSWPRFSGRSLALAGATTVLAVGLVGAGIAPVAASGSAGTPSPANPGSRGAISTTADTVNESVVTFGTDTAVARRTDRPLQGALPTGNP